MVQTGAGANNIFMHVEHIQLADIHHQSHGYFGLAGIINVSNPLAVSDLLNLATIAQEVKNLYDRIAKTFTVQLQIHLL